VQNRKARTAAICLAMAGIPLVTIGTCDPRTGVLDFYRNDNRGHGIFDLFVDDGYYYDDYYYDDYYYDDCFLCF
jgi:hypothetical protein